MRKVFLSFFFLPIIGICQSTMTAEPGNVTGEIKFTITPDADFAWFNTPTGGNKLNVIDTSIFQTNQFITGPDGACVDGNVCMYVANTSGFKSILNPKNIQEATGNCYIEEYISRFLLIRTESDSVSLDSLDILIENKFWYSKCKFDFQVLSNSTIITPSMPVSYSQYLPDQVIFQKRDSIEFTPKISGREFQTYRPSYLFRYAGIYWISLKLIGCSYVVNQCKPAMESSSNLWLEPMVDEKNPTLASAIASRNGAAVDGEYGAYFNLHFSSQRFCDIQYCRTLLQSENPLITGVNNNTAKSNLNVYPNPTADWVYLNNKVEEIQLFDLAGNLLTVQKEDNKLLIEKFEKGSYILKIKDGEVIEQLLLIKQ